MLRDAVETTIVFREKRRKEFLKYGAVSLAMSICFSLTFLLPEFRLRQLILMLLPVLFFGGGGIVLLRWFFSPGIVVKLSPEGITGRMNVGHTVSWKDIRAVKLEPGGETIAIWTDWPVPMWERMSSATRRMLWKRHNRQQAPFVLYINLAAEPPEAILHTIQKELIRARERDSIFRAPEEGGTPSC